MLFLQCFYLGTRAVLLTEMEAILHSNYAFSEKEAKFCDIFILLIFKYLN
jgi:hypothetical protein